MEIETSPTQHLSEQDIASYRQRSLPPEKLFATAEHLANCPPCYANLGADQQLGRTVEVLDTQLFSDLEEECDFLDWQQKAAYVDGKLAQEEVLALETHLRICSDCQAEIHQLRDIKNNLLTPKTLHPIRKQSWQEKLRQVWTIPQIRIPAQAMLALILIGLAVWLGSALSHKKIVGLEQQVTQLQEQNKQLRQDADKVAELTSQLALLRAQPPLKEGSGNPTSPSAEAPLATLKDGEQVILVSPNGELSGLDTTQQPYAKELKLALLQQQLQRAPILSKLSGPTATLMGASRSTQDFALLGPFGQVIQSNQPTFRWSPLPGATGYTVTIYDQKLNALAVSETLSTTEWTLPKPLSRGKIYVWQVRAIKNGEEVIAPKPNEPDAKFAVLGQRQTEELARLSRMHSKSHLLRGIIYLQYGLRDEAIHEFQILSEANTNSTIAQALLKQVRQMK